MSDEKNTPMDPSARETTGGAARPNAKRVCGALKTLSAEVADLFPETTVTYHDYDGRNTALTAAFDYTALDEAARSMFADLMSVLNVDERVLIVEVMGTHEEMVAAVRVRSNPVTQDKREVFGLADAIEASGVYTEDAFLGLAEGEIWGGSL